MNMVKIGVHIIAILLTITFGVEFATRVDGFLLYVSLYPIVFGIPAFILVDLTYLIACALKKRNICIVLSVFDPVVIAVSIAIWGAIVDSQIFHAPVKSLPNYCVETGLASMLTAVFFAVRCCHAFQGNVDKMKRWEWMSFVAVPVATILLAFLFPTLPE